MKAIVFDGQLRYTGVYPKPKPKQNEALIRISMAGICNTDIEIITHEAFHAICALMRSIGVTLDESSEEAYAYPLGFINKKICNFVNIFMSTSF